MTERFDAIVIGTGQAGPALAGRSLRARGTRPEQRRRPVLARAEGRRAPGARADADDRCRRRRVASGDETGRGRMTAAVQQNLALGAIVTGDLWGNFQQTYSMVGIINGATRLSGRWETVP